MRKLYYLAHPYTGAHDMNFYLVNIIANQLIDKGYLIYSPISHNHILHMLKNRDVGFWYEYDLEALKRCDGIILCEGWKNSKGCVLEFDEAVKLGLEIIKIEEIINI